MRELSLMISPDSPLRSAPAGARPITSAPRRAARAAAPQAAKTESIAGLVFESDAVAGELAVVDKATASQSYARTDFHAECEAAINEQIK